MISPRSLSPKAYVVLPRLAVEQPSFAGNAFPFACAGLDLESGRRVLRPPEDTPPSALDLLQYDHSIDQIPYLAVAQP